MATGSASPVSSSLPSVGDFIDQQFDRLDREQEEASTLRRLDAATARHAEELARAQSGIQHLTTGAQQLREMLRQVKSQAQRISLMLSLAVIVLIAILWLRPPPPEAGLGSSPALTATKENAASVNPPGAEASGKGAPDGTHPAKPSLGQASPPTSGTNRIVIRSMTSAVFNPTGASECDVTRPPCSRWKQSSHTSVYEPFENAVTHLLEGIEPGPVIFVIEGGHDSMRVADQKLGDNFRIASRRAYRARTALGPLVPNQYEAVFITTVRGERTKATNAEDRTVTISAIGTALPPEKKQ